jgi:hypothetical protein
LAFVERLAAKPIPLTDPLATGNTQVRPAPPGRRRFLLSRFGVWKAGAVLGVAVLGTVVFLAWHFAPQRVVRRLLDARRGSEALQVIDDVGGEALTPALKQLKAAALHQAGRSEEARKLLESLPADVELEDEAIETLADEFGQFEQQKSGAAVRKLLAGWPKTKVLPALQSLARREEGFTQWGALRFVDLEYAGQGLHLGALYLSALQAKDCGRRRIAAKRLGELRYEAAVEGLTALKNQPRKRGGLLGLEQEECGQSAAVEALRSIERDQGP